MPRSASAYPWQRLPDVSMPEGGRSLHEWLGDRLQTPMPLASSLLGEALRLVRLQLKSRPPLLPPAIPGQSDLVARLQTPAGGRGVLVLSGGLLSRVIPRLERAAIRPGDPSRGEPGADAALPFSGPSPDRPLSPLSPGEAGLVAALLAAALHDQRRAGAGGDPAGGGKVLLEDLDRGDTPGVAWPFETPAALAITAHFALGGAADAAGAAHCLLDDVAAAALRRAATAGPWAAPPARAARLDRLPLRASFQAVRTTLAGARIAGLAPGDVIVFPGRPPAGSGRLVGWLAIGDWRHPALLERAGEGRALRLLGSGETTLGRPGTSPSPGSSPGKQVISSPPPQEDPSPGAQARASVPEDSEEVRMKIDPPGPSEGPDPSKAPGLTDAQPGLTDAQGDAGAQGTSPGHRSPPSRLSTDDPVEDTSAEVVLPRSGDLLDRLPVTLSVYMGEFELTAASVAGLLPGAVIDLDRPIGEPVELRAGRQPVARAELVEVDGSLGVRITEMLL